MGRIVAMDTETDKGKAILITKPTMFCEPKSWEQCIFFLSADKQMGCWNADYDCQAVMKYLPRPVRDRLALLGHADYNFYRIKYIKKKFFRVWFEEKLLFTIFDIQQFYNCRLEDAARSLGVKFKDQIPKSWYGKMREILNDPRFRDKLLTYALGDAETLQQIINRTVEAFRAAGLKFDNPYSNAAFAQRVFKKAFKYEKNWKAEAAAREAYHGGRIECLRAGYFRRAYYYDIHSAYPSEISRLIKPNGIWIFSREIRSDAVYAFIDCEISIPQSEYIGPIPLKRRSGLIVYPLGRFRKTITLTEFRYLERKGWITKIFSAWQHCWPMVTYPFKQIQEIYEKRKKYPAQSYALKIVLNATYGKLAQVQEEWIRTNHVRPYTELFDGRSWYVKEKWKDHTSFVYAAEITARIRTRLIEEIDPKYVIFYATDGIMTTKPINLKTGPGLGEWGGPDEVKDLIVIGSGVYTYKIKEGGKTYQVTTKFRGFSPRLNLYAALAKAGRLHILRTKVLRNTSLRQAMKTPGSLNILRETTRVLSVNFDRKRKWSKFWTAGDLTKYRFTSEPWIYYKPVRIFR